ncbi:reverse transcriptase-like protein [Bacillus andreraoultii]|uniref:reverse transcriptase-like protein n=1 Tax=Bacillus andreraoultii TaxID=1499685 RepID=UPI00053AA957|nr:reverse transcriptase-like protein [Bacillus andreraoultii]
MKFKIKWNYQNKNNIKTTFVSDWIESDSLLEMIEDLEKTGRVRELEFEDETGLTWNKKEVNKILQKLEHEPDDITMFFDGSYQKETGEAGLGVVIYYKQGSEWVRERLNERIDFLESNNEAEYAALHYALKYITNLQVANKKVTIKGDSQGLLMQLLGEWPCYEENLNRWLDRIEKQVEKLHIYPAYELISRNDNKEADQLARQALHRIMINSKQKIGDINR